MTVKGILARIPGLEPCRNVVKSGFYPPVPKLGELLSWHGGFYAYNHGLHVFEGCLTPKFHSLEAWNAPEAWIAEYKGLADGLFFFAEDTFGDQFAWDGEKVVRFLAETGEKEEFADDIDDWLHRIVANPEEELGLQTVEEWRAIHGSVLEGVHLFPRTPLVTGGSLDPLEIVMVDPFENMMFKGNLATQIADVPDGGQIELVVGPSPTERERT